MRRHIPTFIAGLMVAVCFAKGFTTLRELNHEPDVDFVGPGEFRFQASAANGYTLWHSATASVDGVYSVQDQRLPVGTQITVQHAGEIVPTKVSGSNHISSDQGDRTSVLYFTAPESGEYLITVGGMEHKHAFSISAGYGIGPIFRIIGWFLTAFFAAMVLVVLVILAAVKKFQKRLLPPVLGRLS